MMMTTNQKKKATQVLKSFLETRENICQIAGGGSEVQSRVGVPSPGKEVSSCLPIIILSCHHIIIHLIVIISNPSQTLNLPANVILKQ